MILLVIWGCEAPPMLDRVAEAHGAEVVDQGRRAVALFATVGAAVAEPCAADTLDGYALVGQAYRALHVATPSVTIAESGERTYAYGTIRFLDDVGDLTLTSDEARRQWTARYDGQAGFFAAQYLATDCEVDDTGLAVLSALTGTASYTPDGDDEQEVTVEEASGPLTWAPSTAPVPTSGRLTWHVSEQKVEMELDDASGIDPVEYGWPGVAAGSRWSTDVRVLLP